MGKVKIDLFKRQVLYDQAFDLGTPDGVLRFLRCYHELKARRDEGDLEASILLMDFHKVWDEKPLAPRQHLAIHYIYGLGLSKKETAEKMGVTIQTVKDFEQKAAKKLADLIGGHNDRSDK